MSFKHTDLDGDVVEIYKANPTTPDSHYVDTSSSPGVYIPFEKTSELVTSLYHDMGVTIDPSLPFTDSAARSETIALTYARRAMEQRGDEALQASRQEARDQLVKDFFKRTKDVTLDQVTPENRAEYEVTCRFFDTSPYDAPGAR